MIFLIVKEKCLNSAYGLITCAYNIGLIVIPMLTGYIYDATNSETLDTKHGYYYVGMWYII